MSFDIDPTPPSLAQALSLLIMSMKSEYSCESFDVPSYQSAKAKKKESTGTRLNSHPLNPSSRQLRSNRKNSSELRSAYIVIDLYCFAAENEKAFSKRSLPQPEVTKL